MKTCYGTVAKNIHTYFATLFSRPVMISGLNVIQ